MGLWKSENLLINYQRTHNTFKEKSDDAIFTKTTFFWQVIENQFINIYVSYLFSRIIRKLLNPKDRKEGEPLSSFSILLQNVLLPFTQLLDPIFKVKKDVAKLAFVKKV